MMRLTLDEAIRRVLIESDRGLTVAEITQAIRERKLYLRHDGHPPERSQVSVRIHGRPALFQFDRSTYPATVILRADAGADKPLADAADIPRGSAEPSEALEVTEEWWWEGNVQARVVKYLEEQGCTVRSKANTEARARGEDILAYCDDRTLVVEVKGYPSTRYRSGTRAGQHKPTNPRLQARHWYSDALLSAMLHRGSHPDFEIAVALPDVDRYRDLVNRTEKALRDLRVGVFLVPEAGPPIQRIVPPGISSDPRDL